MRAPCATYRLQFNGDFTFSDASALVPYLARLGVGDLYASPYLKARPGSTHGNDVIDPTSLNPELGSERDYPVTHGRWFAELAAPLPDDSLKARAEGSKRADKRQP